MRLDSIIITRVSFIVCVLCAEKVMSTSETIERISRKLGTVGLRQNFTRQFIFGFYPSNSPLFTQNSNSFGFLKKAACLHEQLRIISFHATPYVMPVNLQRYFCIRNCTRTSTFGKHGLFPVFFFSFKQHAGCGIFNLAYNLSTIINGSLKLANTKF
jgi:hypothetical protein